MQPARNKVVKVKESINNRVYDFGINIKFLMTPERRLLSSKTLPFSFQENL